MRSLTPFVGLATPVAVGVLLWSAAAEPLSQGEELANSQHGASITLSDNDAWRGVDARGSLSTAVGRFTGTKVCTAAIVVHPRIIVTAGHCIAGSDGSASRSKSIFHLTKGEGTNLYPFEATVWALGSRQLLTAQSAAEAASDWAILILDRVPFGIRPLRLQTTSTAELTQLERQVMLPSYGIDATGALSLGVDPTCSVRGLVWNVLLHNCKASPGASGAPLLIRYRQWYAVVGIHTGSMWASDEQGHIAKPIGNSASSSWSFSDALVALARRLDGDAPHDVAQHGH